MATVAIPQPSASAAVGVIFPPSDIRGIIDKTAQFVAKNGPEFETRVMREQNNPRFAFLYSNNPYRSYYEMKVREYKSGSEEVAKPTVPQAILDMKKKEEEKKQKKEQLLMLTQYGDKDKELKPPEAPLFSVQQPLLTALDVDIIKTTAQFVARNGQRFLVGLTQRERNNPQFDFIKPTHAVFTYFSSLVEAYTRCLMPTPKQLEQLKEESKDSTQFFRRSYQRCLWEMEEERKKQEKEEKDEEERAQMQSIDWHDFVIVETIEFTAEDETLPLAAPIDFSTQSSRSPMPLDNNLMKDVPSENAEDLGDGSNEAEDMEMDEEDMDVDEVEIEDEKEMDEVKAPNEPADSAPPVPTDDIPPVPEAEDIHVAGQPASMKIRRDYVRLPKKRAAEETRMQKCPITGVLVPAAELSDHLRILLLDPKWKEQKDRFLEKAKKESAFAPMEDVEGNLASFVVKRPDLFGSVEDEILEHAADPLGIEVPAAPGGYDPTRGSSHPLLGPTAMPPKIGIGVTGLLPAPIPGPSIAPALLPTPTSEHAHATKKSREADSGEVRMSEERFVENYPDPVVHVIRWLGSEGKPAQRVELEVNVRLTAAELKKQLKDAGIADDVELELKDLKSGGILSDTNTLAFYNLGPKSELEMRVK